jgi:hypothetical protein
VSGGANEPDDAAFDVGQKNVLLRFVKAVDFVDEQNGALAGIFLAIAGGGKDAPHVGDIGFDTAEAFELAPRLIRDDLRERSFAGAGRAVENQRLNAIGFNSAAKKLAGREDVFLPGEFVEIARTHARSERLLGYDSFFLRLGWSGGLFAFCGEKVVASHSFSILRRTPRRKGAKQRLLSNSRDAG